METLQLNDGHNIPVLGLGTWNVNADKLGSKEKCQEVFRQALEIGYKHFDSAALYENETELGEVLAEFMKDGRVKRGDLFITTKLQINSMEKTDVRAAFEDSLMKLQLSYADLYLIHAPFGVKKIINDDGDEEEKVCDIVETWKELEQLVEEGKVRSIGVSNFNSEQISRICANAKIKPVVNQVECHAYLQQKPLQDFCQKYGIILTAFGPLGSPGFQKEARDNLILPLKDPVIQELATKYNRTPAQILLRNLIQRNITVVAKSISPERIRENLKVLEFCITPEDMVLISKLDCDRRIFHFKDIAGATDHPEYPFNIPY